jgi:ubiquinone biosynthesis protein UbiJ
MMTIPLPTWLFSAAVPKLILLLNHVISTEEAALVRLRPHAGRYLRLDCQGPAVFPAMPPLVVEITPAGLLDWVEHAESVSTDLRIALDASQPAAVFLDGLRGQRPRVDVSGDAALAGDINWLIENLRWDIEDDLALAVGPVMAREMVRWGTMLGTGVREAAGQFANLAGRWGSGAPSA